MTTTILGARGARLVDVHPRWLGPTTVLALLAGCTDGGEPVTEAQEVAAESEPIAAESAPIEQSLPPPTTTTTTAAPSTSTSAAEAPTFVTAVRVVGKDDLGSSWREGCPMAVEDLRWVDLTHWNNEGFAIEGAMVVHADHADDVVTVFAAIFAARFPIQSMRPITEFAADDDASMAANNTSAFNCREINGRPGEWSQHAYGGAIDINPLVNPWVRGSQVDPPAGAPYVDRTVEAPGLIVAGDAVTQAFAAIGWGWGGDWTNSLDYQHFSHNGR